MNNLTSKKNDLTFHAMRQQVMKKMQKYGIDFKGLEKEA